MTDDDARPPAARLAGRGAALAVAAVLDDLEAAGATRDELWRASLGWLLARDHGRADRAELAAALRTLADAMRAEAWRARSLGGAGLPLAAAQAFLRAAARDLAALHRAETQSLTRRSSACRHR